MKRIIIIIFIAIVVVILAIIGWNYFRANENGWICEKGVWQKRGNPTTPPPASGCQSLTNANEVKVNKDALPEYGNIIVYLPQYGQTVKSPIYLEGQARGMWFFEATFPVALLNENDKEIATSYVTAQSDWMSEGLVRFKGEINFEIDHPQAGLLVFKKDNPSGLPENREEYKVPVYLTADFEMIKVKAFFNNNLLDPEITCVKVFPVEREIIKTPAVARAALEELLRGPLDKETIDGYVTNINPGVVIQNLTIENGIAKVDFNDQLEYQVGGSCRVSAIRAQITETLKQFPTVQEVIISINGRTEDILQP